MSAESGGTSPPSFRESIMRLLESCKDSMDVLGKELGIDTTQCKAVCEVVATFEVRDGQELSLDKWRSIFQSLGCLEVFENLLPQDSLHVVNSLDNCPPNNVSSKAEESLLKKSEELRQQNINPADGHSLSTLPESELPSKPEDDVMVTWKTSTAPGVCPGMSFSPPLEDKPSTDVLKSTNKEVKSDEEEHLRPFVVAAQGMVTGHQFRPNNPKTVQVNGVFRDGQKILENSSLLCGGFSPPLPEASSLATASQFDLSLNSDGKGTRPGMVSPDLANSQSPLEENQGLQPSNHMVDQENAEDHDGQTLQLSPGINGSILPVAAMQDSVNQLQQATPSGKYGIDETEDSNSSSQSDTEVSLSSGDSTTPSWPVAPEAVNSPQLGQLHPNNIIAGEAIVANHDRLVLPYDPQFSVASNAIRLPAVPSRSVVHDRVGQYTYDQDEAEGNSSSVQSDPNGSLSSDDSRTQSRTFSPQAVNFPQLYQLHSNNPMTVEANTGVNRDEPAWGMPLDSQQSSAVHIGSAVQDPVGQTHQGMAWDIYNTDEEETSSSSSQCDTDASLSSHDSSVGAQLVVPQAANSPSPLTLTDHHLDVNNPVAGQADAPGQAFGNQPSENDDETQYMNIQQVYPLQFEDIAHLIQKLRKKCTKLEACKQDLQHSRQQCAQLQETIDEYERLLDGSNHLQQENQRLIRMTEEMCELKDQEIQQLRQLCEQKDQDVETLSAQNESLRGEYIQVLHELDRRNNSFQQQMESIIRERQELSEQLRHSFQVVEQSQRELYAERESLWLDNDRLLDQRMTDEVKILQQELDGEKRKRTEAEERSRCLFEENCQLNAMVKELMSRPAELAEVSCSALSPDTVQENLVSSSNDSTVGEADEESDEDEEVFEDALDHSLKGADLERKF